MAYGECGALKAQKLAQIGCQFEAPSGVVGRVIVSNPKIRGLPPNDGDSITRIPIECWLLRPTTKLRL